MILSITVVLKELLIDSVRIINEIHIAVHMIENKFKKDCLYIFVSQSGETADTYAALDLCNKNKLKTCSVVNVVESSIARESKFVLPIHCGPEIGVASTKAFLGQMLVLYILCIKLAYERKEIDKKLIIGSVFFGAGWGLIGLCPGPAITSIALLNMSSIIFVVSMFSGFYIASKVN